MKQYNPKSFLRQVPNETLAQFFSRFDAFAGFDWSQVRKHRLDLVDDRWHEMPEAEKTIVNCVFRQAHALSSSQGTLALLEAAEDRGVDIGSGLRARRNGHDRALWCYLVHQDIFNDGRALAHIEGLPRCSWERRNGLPKRPIEVTPARVAALEQEVSKFYVKLQDRGESCTVEYRRRSSGIDSFFAYPADYADEVRSYTESGELTQQPVRKPFEVVFNYRSDTGTIDMYAQGGKKVRGELAEMFARVVLDVNEMPKPWRRPVYDLEAFQNPGITFFAEPEDGIRSVRVKTLQLRVRDRVGGRVTFEIGRKWSGQSVYDLVAPSLDEQRLALDRSQICAVRLQANLQAPGSRQSRSVTFRISPSSCNLGDSPEEQILWRKLREWGIEQDA